MARVRDVGPPHCLGGAGGGEEKATQQSQRQFDAHEPRTANNGLFASLIANSRNLEFLAITSAQITGAWSNANHFYSSRKGQEHACAASVSSFLLFGHAEDLIQCRDPFAHFADAVVIKRCHATLYRLLADVLGGSALECQFADFGTHGE